MWFLNLVLVFALIGFYFAPALIAARNKKRNQTAIFLTNLFFGWSVVGWILALIWASTVDNKNN